MMRSRRDGWDLAKEQGVEKVREPLVALPEKHVATITTGRRKRQCSPMGIQQVFLGPRMQLSSRCDSGRALTHPPFSWAC